MLFGIDDQSTIQTISLERVNMEDRLSIIYLIIDEIYYA